MRALAERSQPVGGFVFVEGVFVDFPDVKVILAHREQHGNIRFSHNVAFAELRVLHLAGNDAREVVAEDMPHGVFRIDQLHAFILPLFF